MIILEFLFSIWLLIIIAQWIGKILTTDYTKKKGLNGWNWR